MSLETAKQLYADVQTLTAAVYNRKITDNMVILFNANLDAAVQEFPDDPILKAIGHATNITENFDLLVMAGQLTSGLSGASADQRTANQKTANSRIPPKMV